MKARTDSRFRFRLSISLTLFLVGCSTPEAIPPLSTELHGTVLCTTATPLAAPNALLTTSLEDLSNPDDLPLTIARNTQSVASGLPAAFSLPYPAAQVHSGRPYNLRAEIAINGQTLHASPFVNDPFRPQPGEERIIRVACDRPAGHPLALTDTLWQALPTAASRPDAPGAGILPFIELKSRGGRIRGFSGCRTFGGTFVTNQSKRTLRFEGLLDGENRCKVEGTAVPTQTGSTDPFIDHLRLIDHYTITGYHLSLYGRDGTLQLRLLAVDTP